MKNCQASLEFMAGAIIFSIMTSIIISYFYDNQRDLIIKQDYYDAEYQCLSFSNAVSQSLKHSSFYIDYYVLYNMSINSSAGLIEVFNKDNVAFCSLSTHNISMNSLGVFNLSVGEYTIVNKYGYVEVIG